MTIKAVLVWNDGREEVTQHGGAIRIIRPWRHEDGRFFETAFDIDPSTATEKSEVWCYREGETRDSTEDMKRAAEENAKRTWKYLRKGWGR